MKQAKKAKLVLLLPSIERDDEEIIGSGYYHMATLFDKGIPIPPSLVVTSEGFQYFAEFGNLKNDISKMIDSGLVNRRRFERIIADTKIPPIMQSSISQSYKRIGGFSEPTVIVIPYAFTEESIYPLKEESRQIVQGEAQVLEAIKRAWMDLSLDHISNIQDLISGGLRFGIMIEKLPTEEVSGLMYTADIATNNKDHIWIEAAYGSWDIIDKEGFVPDQYIYSKSKEKIVDKHINKQDHMLVRRLDSDTGGALDRIDISNIWQSSQKLDDKYLDHLAKIGFVIEEYFGEPYEVGWVYEGGKLWVVWLDPLHRLGMQAERKPVSIELEEKSFDFKPEQVKKPRTWDKTISSKKLLVKGEGNIEGYVSGKVIKDISLLKDTKNPVWVTTKVTNKGADVIHQLTGLITDKGSKASVGMVVSKMKGIPAITNTAIATKILEQGDKIWIDSMSGTVYGKEDETSKTVTSFVEYTKRNEKQLKKKSQYTLQEMQEKIQYDRTATKIYSVYAQSLTQNLGRLNCLAQFSDGVVLKKFDKARDFLNAYGSTNKPALIKIPSEKDISSTAKWVYKLRTSDHLRNISVILPAFSKSKIIPKWKTMLLDAGLRRSRSFSVFITVAKPANLFEIEDILEIGLDGLWIDSGVLQKNMTNRSLNKINRETVRAVTEAAEKAIKSDVDVFLDLSVLKIGKALALDVVKSGIIGIGVDEEHEIVEMRNLLGELEHKRILGR